MNQYILQICVVGSGSLLSFLLFFIVAARMMTVLCHSNNFNVSLLVICNISEEEIPLVLTKKKTITEVFLS